MIPSISNTLLAWGLEAFPRHSLALAWLLARTHYAANRNRRARIQESLHQAFPDWDEKTLRERTQCHIDSYCQNGLGALWARHLDPRSLQPILESLVWDLPDPSPFETPGPIILMVPHYGNFFLGDLAIFSRLAGRREVGIFLDDPKKNLGNAIYVEASAKVDPAPSMLFNNPRDLLKALKILKRGGVIIIMPDVFETTPNLLFVPFLGKLSMAMEGTALLAIRSKAAIFPSYCFLSRDQRWTFKADARIDASCFGKTDGDIYELTTVCFKAMESQIRQFPEPWVYWETLLDRNLGNLNAAPFQWEKGLSLLRDQSVHQPMLRELEKALRQSLLGGSLARP